MTSFVIQAKNSAKSNRAIKFANQRNELQEKQSHSKGCYKKTKPFFFSKKIKQVFLHVFLVKILKSKWFHVIFFSKIYGSILFAMLFQMAIISWKTKQNFDVFNRQILMRNRLLID